jgi:GT2 family glycosyltransferase
LNRAKALERTLRSLEVQTRIPDEVVVILQGDMPAIPEERGKLRLVVLRQQIPNAQRARNAAALKASGELLLFLDDDIEADPDLAEIFLKAFEDRMLGAACGMILEPGQTQTLEVPAVCSEEPLGWTRFPLNYGGDSDVRNFSSCNTCVRREVFLESDGFDENFVATLLDDSDWSLRLRTVLDSAGLRGMHLGRAKLRHFREPTGGRRIARLSRYVKIDAEGWASRLYFWRKNYGGRAWREMLRFIRMDLLCGSLLIRPGELFAAWEEFRLGWRLASKRLAAGPKLLRNG